MKVDKRFSQNRKYKHSRLYFFHERETLGENLFNRRHRSHREYRKLLPEVLERAGLPANTKAKWSQYAGCSMCPCSPGFILDVSSYLDSNCRDGHTCNP